jgi:hypothetical protein
MQVDNISKQFDVNTEWAETMGQIKVNENNYFNASNISQIQGNVGKQHYRPMHNDFLSSIL